LILSTLMAAYLFTIWGRTSKLNICFKFYLFLLSLYGVFMTLQNLGFIVQTAGG